MDLLEGPPTADPQAVLPRLHSRSWVWVWSVGMRGACVRAGQGWAGRGGGGGGGEGMTGLGSASETSR